MAKDESVLVFTCKGLETLIKFNGSQSWKLNRKRVLDCKYLICSNNTSHVLSENLNDHGQAFLVAKISNVSRPLGTIFDDRWIIEFSEYAEVNVPNFWKSWRNPVIYLPNSEIEIDFESLVFNPVPDRDFEYIEEVDKKERKYFNLPPLNEVHASASQDHKNSTDFLLTIDDAKVGLSNNYNIPEENIEIILRG